MRKRKTKKKVDAKEEKALAIHARQMGLKCAHWLHTPFWRVHGRIHTRLSPQYARERFTFSSLTLCGRRRNYSILRLNILFYTDSRGILFKTRRYLGRGELDLVISNHLVGSSESRKVWPWCWLNRSGVKISHAAFWRMQPIVPRLIPMGIRFDPNLGTIGLIRPKLACCILYLSELSV